MTIPRTLARTLAPGMFLFPTLPSILFRIVLVLVLLRDVGGVFVRPSAAAVTAMVGRRFANRLAPTASPLAPSIRHCSVDELDEL